MKADFRNSNWRPRRTALKRCRTLESVVACIVVIGLVNGLSASKIFKPNRSSKCGHLLKDSETESVKTPKPIEICDSKDCIDTATAILSKMNTEIDPCDDFYQYACGNHIKNTKIPGDKGSVNSFSEVSDVLQKQLNDIINEKRPKTDPKHLRLPFGLYTGCMNTNKIQSLGSKPIKEIAEGLGGWPVIVGNGWNANKTWTLQETLKKLGRLGFSIGYIFEVFVQVDIKDSTKHIITLDQPSTVLDRQTLNMGWTNSLVYDYLKYMIEMALLFGADLKTANHDLEKSLQFGIDLAKISLPMEDRRNFSNLYNLRSITQLQESYPFVNWLDLFNALLPEGLKVDKHEMVIVSVPSYFDGLGKLLNSTDNRVIANFLMWCIHDYSADFLSEKFRNKKWKFNTALTGKKEEEARWKQCAKTVLDNLPISVGHLYVNQHFKQDSKDIVLEMFENIRNAFLKLLNKVRWMDDETKQKAKTKLLAMTPHVGYPDEMMDNDNLEKYYLKLSDFDPDKYFESVLRLNVFENENSFSKLKLQENNSAWISYADPAFADAYYTPTENSIILPAGILQGEFFNPRLPMGMNYAGIGTLIGHELSHGFDDKGRQFDVDGNLNDWWQPATEKTFLKRAKCIVKQYDNYKDKQTGLNLNGKNTVGENIADYGGYMESYLAYTQMLAKNGDEPKLLGLENFSLKQTFWLKAAQVWCSKYKTAFLEGLIETDFHAPKEFRVLGPLRNIKSFARDFQCTTGKLMNPAKKCKLW